MSRPVPSRYRTTNWKSCNAALEFRGSLTVWFDRDMRWQAQLSGKTGRNQTFSDAAVQFCLTMKVLFRLSLCQTTGFVHSLLQFPGLEWSVADCSTLCHRQKHIRVVILYRFTGRSRRVCAC
ncbi:MAG: hypothetical protein BWY87_00810 [Deltaproteobacteria bacterium ADurb.Bin510]|nr:MAG: hypothetical protein BWY87_00810 [Deltaproteobacteria bacterium ADurb.Bin510]